MSTMDAQSSLLELLLPQSPRLTRKCCLDYVTDEEKCEHHRGLLEVYLDHSDIF